MNVNSVISSLVVSICQCEDGSFCPIDFIQLVIVCGNIVCLCHNLCKMLLVTVPRYWCMLNHLHNCQAASDGKWYFTKICLRTHLVPVLSAFSVKQSVLRHGPRLSQSKCAMLFSQIFNDTTFKRYVCAINFCSTFRCRTRRDHISVICLSECLATCPIFCVGLMQLVCYYTPVFSRKKVESIVPVQSKNWRLSATLVIYKGIKKDKEDTTLLPSTLFWKDKHFVKPLQTDGSKKELLQEQIAGDDCQLLVHLAVGWLRSCYILHVFYKYWAEVMLFVDVVIQHNPASMGKLG